MSEDDPGETESSADRPDAEIDLDELRELVAELSDANDAVRAYGEDHTIPAIERTAERIDGTIATLRQNVPGALSEREE